MIPEARDEKQTRLLSKHDHNYVGGNVEKEIFEKIKECFQHSRLKNVTIFFGWKDDGIIEKSVSREFDVFVVSGDAKKVIQIEVKNMNHYSNKQLNKATEQLSKGYRFLRNKIPFAKNWKFVGVAYLKSDETKNKGDFILGPKSSFRNFFEKQLQSSSVSADVSYKVMTF